MGRILGWILVLQLAAGRLPAADLLCPLIPEFEEKTTECRADSPPDHCAWSEYLRALVGLEDHPEKYLAERLGLPPELGSRLWFPGFLLANEFVDPTCIDNLDPVIRALMDGHSFLEEARLNMFVLTFENPSSKRIAVDLKEFDEAFRPALARAASAYSELLRRTGREGLVEKRMLRRRSADFTKRAGAFDDYPGNPINPAAGRELVDILDDFSDGRPAEGRPRLRRLIRNKNSRFQLRVGFACFRRGLLEEADWILRQVERRLAPAALCTDRSLYLLALTLWTRAQVVTEMGLTEEAIDLREKLNAFTDPVVGALIKSLMEPSMNNIGAPLVVVNVAALMEAGDLAKKRGTDAELERALLTLYNPEIEVEPDPDAPIELRSAIGADLQAGRLADAEGKIEQLLSLYPHYDNLGDLEVLLQEYQVRGQAGDVIRVGGRIAGQLDVLLASYRSQENARAFVDQQAQEFYDFIVDATSWVAPGFAAFELAERGRVYNLRRMVGQAGIPGESPLSERESQLEAEILRLQRQDPASGLLKTLYLQFAGIRRERQVFGQGRRLDASFGEILKIADLQKSLRVNEAILAYFLITPQKSGSSKIQLFPEQPMPRLWLWVVTRDGAVQRLSNFPETAWAQLDCLVDQLHWQTAPGEARRIGLERGAQILERCSEDSYFVDPAIALFGLLIVPVVDLLRPGQRLIVVPHAGLHRVPFAALREPYTGRWMVEDFEMLVVPSATIFSRLRGSGQPDRRRLQHEDR